MELLKKIRAEEKRLEKQIGADRDGGRFRYHGLMRSVREIVKADNERKAGHSETLTQFRLSSKRGRT